MILSLLSYQLPFNYTIGLLVIHLFCVVMALTAHEFSHGFVASKLGDPTAGYQGRLTLNPLAHIDLVGFLMMLLFGFGWAKPVPVNPRLMRKPKRDMALTSLAGPAINICLALLGGIAVGAMLRMGYNPVALFLEFALGEVHVMSVVSYTIYMFTLLNIGLALFNLITLPPLDGSNILVALLPNNIAAKYLQIRYYTRYIFIGIMVISLLADRITLFAQLDYIIWWPFNELRFLLLDSFMNLGYLLFGWIG